jgi:hypothetical protein
MKNLHSILHKRVTEVTKDIPFFAYKQLTEEELSSFSKHKNSTLFNLRDKIIIDRLYLQRLLTLWPELKIALYIRDFYNGFDKINAFVCVSLDEIIRVLKEIKGKTNNKSTIIHFIAEMESAKENGKEWLLINGQHRDIIWEKVWNNDIKLPIDFPSVGDKVIGESYWNEIDINTRCLLLTKTHPITFVNQFTSMSDLTHIVNLHNEGSEWNAHEKRSIEASYIMQQFRKLDDDKTLKLLFKKLYASGNYEIGKKEMI